MCLWGTKCVVGVFGVCGRKDNKRGGEGQRRTVCLSAYSSYAMQSCINVCGLEAGMCVCMVGIVCVIKEIRDKDGSVLTLRIYI